VTRGRKSSQISEIREKSVEVYNLNRDHLVQARRRAISELRLSLTTGFFFPGFREKLLEDLRAGRREYSAALKRTVDDWWNEQVAEVNRQLNS